MTRVVGQKLFLGGYIKLVKASSRRLSNHHNHFHVLNV